jgi:hypothetical protein
MGSDGAYKILPGAVVCSYYALLVCFTSTTLNVSHCLDRNVCHDRVRFSLTVRRFLASCTALECNHEPRNSLLYSKNLSHLGLNNLRALLTPAQGATLNGKFVQFGNKRPKLADPTAQAKNKRQHSQIPGAQNAVTGGRLEWKRLGRCRAFQTTAPTCDSLVWLTRARK